MVGELHGGKSRRDSALAEALGKKKSYGSDMWRYFVICELTVGPGAEHNYMW
jgi:hypothetical protein